jgi:serine-type D-Ala-D-Ala carboxypeptidase/endopeptidase (penicillin-binding protein 4)
VQAELQLVERDRLAESLFRTVWRTLGGQFSGRVREGLAPAGTRVLVRRESRPLGELVRHINKESDNPQTRLVFLSLGLKAMEADRNTPTAELAARAMRAWFDEQGISTEGLVLDNGSGLSRSERITPQALAQVLQAAWRGRYSSELMMSLPEVGSETARRRRASQAAAFSRMKGGLLRDVLSLAGYVRDTEGRWWAVVAILNHAQATRHAAVLHAVVDAAARGLLFDAPAPSGPQGEGP